MSHCFVFHRVQTAARSWQAVAETLASGAALPDLGGSVYGIWRSQIGRPRDELSAITVWSGDISAGDAHAAFLSGTATGIVTASSELMTPTLRPNDPSPPVRQGNYAFRWFVTPEDNRDEFLLLCAAAWPGFEAAYDSQVIGLWRFSDDREGRCADEASGVGMGTGVRSLLLTRRPDLAMWERSKLPQGEAESEVRAKLSRRYDLCDWTAVSTHTLLTAQDEADTARWT